MALRRRDGAIADFMYSGQILLRLRRQPHHEVELHAVPTVLEGRLEGRVYRLVGDALVYHVAQPLRPGLGREGQAALAHRLKPRGEADREGVDAQARQRKLYLVVRQHRREALERLRDSAPVAGREREQADLLPAGLVEQRLDLLADRGRGAFAHGAVYHSGLAEAAAARAALEDLHRDAVVDDAGVRHYHRSVEEILVEILDYPAAHGLAVEALRHVDALDFG